MEKVDKNNINDNNKRGGKQSYKEKLLEAFKNAEPPEKRRKLWISNPQAGVSCTFKYSVIMYYANMINYFLYIIHVIRCLKL